jgi:hypothetical protein
MYWTKTTGSIAGFLGIETAHDDDELLPPTNRKTWEKRGRCDSLLCIQDVCACVRAGGRACVRVVGVSVFVCVCVRVCVCAEATAGKSVQQHHRNDYDGLHCVCRRAGRLVGRQTRKERRTGTSGHHQICGICSLGRDGNSVACLRECIIPHRRKKKR